MPNSYEFEISRDSLNALVLKIFSERKGELNVVTRSQAENINFSNYYYINPILYKLNLNSTSCNYIFIPGLLIKDEYLDNLNVYGGMGLSFEYIFESTEISPVYDACFKVVIDSISPNKSLAKVETFNSQIAIGRKITLNPHGGFFWAPVWLPVEPSTIEEYQILLRIGDALGVKELMQPFLKNKKDE